MRKELEAKPDRDVQRMNFGFSWDTKRLWDVR
jgi:hypothetical protein